MISIKEVEHVALLSRLELTSEEKELFAKQLSKMLEYARRLQDLDTENVPPTAHILPLQNVFRDDHPGEHMPVDKVLANAPESQEYFFKVPKIL